jgi:hypothetical protein
MFGSGSGALPPETEDYLDRLPARTGACRAGAAQHVCHFCLGNHAECVARMARKIMDGLISGQASACLAHGAIIAESLQASLTLRHAEAEPWQHLSQSVDANSDIIGPRHRLDVSQPRLLQLAEKCPPALLRGQGVMRQEVRAVKVAFG